MARTCPKCHAENTDTSKFCGNCATALGAAGRPKPGLTKTLKRPAADLVPGFVIGKEYEILEKLGRGGMGEVYRALDRHLDRQVAIKVLPEEFGADPERLARFRREAKLLAALNHPNIEAVHELEESGERKYLILEMVEGETLQARLDRGALAIDEALETCRQVAAGLEAAHEKGIVHRDLKPGKIMITADGQAKILDFGLAKAEGSETTGFDIANSPTITAQMTEPGIILGTAAYMSPEQARGRAVDKRADIWAWGCVLYECLTGRRAFQGETVSDTLAQILKGEPHWTALPAATPACIRSLLARCLKKDRKERLRDIGDARLEIEEALSRSDEAVPVSRKLSPLMMASIAGGVLIAGILIDRLLIRRPPTPPPAQVVTSTIKVEPGLWLDGRRQAAETERPSRKAMTISGDGSFIVYSAIEENPGPQAKPRLFLRRLVRSEAKPIPGTEGGIHPFLAPDDRWVGFWADGLLKKIPVDGGVATTLCECPSIFGASWGPGNVIVYSPDPFSGLSIISAAGGKPEIITVPDPKLEESSHRLPFWLPDGKAFLFSVMKNPWDERPALALYRTDTHEQRILIADAADARFVLSGHLLFLRQGTLMAVRFDPGRREVIGQPVALKEDVQQAFSTHSTYHTTAGQFAVSRTGSLIYAAGGIVPDRRNSLVWVDRLGVEEAVPSPPLPYVGPRLSPDGRKIAYLVWGRKAWIGTNSLESGTNGPLPGEGLPSFPIWTPDGRSLLFGWIKAGVQSVYRQLSDGSSLMERLTTSGNQQDVSSCLPDGKSVAIVEVTKDTGADVRILDIPSGSVTPFLDSKFNERYPEFSPDGRWLAYASDESGRNEIYVRPFPGPGMKYAISTEGGREPLWSRDSRLFYRWQGQIWEVDVRTDGAFSASRPRLLFDKPGYMATGEPIRSYDLSFDGKKFLMVKLEQRKPSPVTELVLVQNWFEELKRLVPAK